MFIRGIFIRILIIIGLYLNNYYILSIVIFCAGNFHYIETRITQYIEAKDTQQKKYEFPFELLNEDYDRDTIVIYKTLDDQKHSYITFLKDKNGDCYLVKQDRSFSLKAQLQVALEMLCAHIASSLNIPAHRVELLPVGFCFPGKPILEKPATIHTLMTGCVIKDIPDKRFLRFSINQGGNQTSPAQGLTITVIKYMSRHSDLPQIVALDTFTANRDRSRKNLIYDTYNNRFYAIDMALVYDVPLQDSFIPYLSCKNVELMIENKILFKKRKWRALNCYYNTLLQLLERFPPEKTYSLLYEFAQKSGLIEKYKDTIAFENLLLKYKTVIEKAYNENKRLVSLLGQLLHNSSYVK